MNNSDIINQLPGDLKRIAEVVGVDVAIRIAKEFRGTYLYIHSLDDLLREIRDKKIREEYTAGKKVRELAIKYGLTERWIWNILGVEPDQGSSPSLLDLLK